VLVATPDSEPYFIALRKGFVEFTKDRLLRDFTWLLALTNLFAQVFTVIFVPMWVFTMVKSPVALGIVSVTYALGSIVGNALFTAIAPYLSRYRTVSAGFLLGGAPALLVLALSDSPVVVGVVTFFCGLAMCSVNPTFGAMIFQRVPSEMLARVGGIIAAITFFGMPLGGLVGGWLVHRFGLVDGILVASVLLFAVTLIPVVRRSLWVELNTPVRRVGYRPYPFGLRVTLSYIDGEWTAWGRRGFRVFMSRRSVPTCIVLKGFDQIEVPALREALGIVAERDLIRVQDADQRLRDELRAKELMLADITAYLEHRHLP
jgi:MFS family permease